MQMTQFCIWYDDHIRTGQTPEDWAAMPEDGVVAIYEFFFRGEDGIPRAQMHSGSDWYWLGPDGRIGENGASTMKFGEWMEHDAPEGAILKRGAWVSSERLAEVDAQLLEMIQNGP